MTSFQGKIMVGDGDLIANIDNQSYHASKEHPMYNQLFEAFKNGDAETFVDCFNVKQCMETYINPENIENGIQLVDQNVFYNGVKLNNAVVETIQNMMQLGLDFQPMLRFLERAIKSNSKRVVDELFRFIEACGLTITEDGCFLAYKTVTSEYYDKYSNSVLNAVGALIERKERWQVDDDCNRTCSQGYHVGALAYAGPGGWYNSQDDHVMICKVAPEDVVSVPVDHDGQKLRCCWYEVVGEFKARLQPAVYSGKVGDTYDKPPQPKRTQVEIDPEHLCVDSMYSAQYTDKDGETRTRYFVVLDTLNDHVIVELVEPENNVGNIRRFDHDGLSNIHYIKEYDEYDEYEEEEDEEEEETHW